MTNPPPPGQPQWPPTGNYPTQHTGPGQMPSPGYQAPPQGYPMQPGYGQPPPGWRPGPPPKKKTSVWPWVAVVLIVLVMFSACLSAGEDLRSNGSDSTSVSRRPAPAAAPAPKDNIQPLGSEVRDGKFAFRVTDVSAPVTKVGSGWSEETAKGEFIIISLDVTNTGNEPRDYSDSNQILFDDRGREFASDSNAADALDSETWEVDLNPGFTIQVKVVFDVPAGTVPAVLELHDSSLSSGAKVALK